MKRITLYIYVILVCSIIIPISGNAQEPIEVPGQRRIEPNSLSIPQPARRIPDSFSRHDDLPGKVISGEILSLSEIRKAVRDKYPGRIVDVQLLVPRREGLNYLYDVKVLTDAGKLVSVKVDAKSAQIVDVKG